MPFHGGLLDKLGGGARTIFGGRADPRLSPEENRGASNDALITAGLSTLLASGPGGVSPTTLQALSAGALSGRAAGASARETRNLQNQQVGLQQLVDQGASPLELFFEAISSGDTDSARILGDMVRVQSTSGAQTRVREMTGSEGPGVYSIDSTGREIEKVGDLLPKGVGGQRFTNLDDYRSAETGEDFVGIFDGVEQKVIRIPGVIPARTGTQQATEGLGDFAAEALKFLEPLAADLGTVMSDFASRGGVFGVAANAVITDRQQVGITAANNFLNVTVRWLSGAQMTDRERTNYALALLPRAFDRAPQRAMKSILRRKIVEAMQSGSFKGRPTVDEEGNLIADVQNMNAWISQATSEAFGELLSSGRFPELGPDAATVDGSDPNDPFAGLPRGPQ